MGGIGGMDFNIWFWGGWWLLGGGGLVFLKAMPALSSRQNFLHNFWAEWMLLAGAAAFCEEGIKKSIVLSFFTKIDFLSTIVCNNCITKHRTMLNSHSYITKTQPVIQKKKKNEGKYIIIEKLYLSLQD